MARIKPGADPDTIPAPCQGALPVLCPITADTVTVKWNGDVIPCCWDLNGVAVIGNVRKQPLATIINERVPEFRLRMSQGKAGFDSCRDCYFHNGWKVHEQRLRRQLEPLAWPGKAGALGGVDALATDIEEADAHLAAKRTDLVVPVLTRCASELQGLTQAFDPSCAQRPEDVPPLSEAGQEVRHLANYAFQLEDVSHEFSGQLTSPARGHVSSGTLRVQGHYSSGTRVGQLTVSIDGAQRAAVASDPTARTHQDSRFELIVPLDNLRRSVHLVSVDAAIEGGRLRKRIGDFLVHPDDPSGGWVAGTFLKPSYTVFEAPAHELTAPPAAERIAAPREADQPACPEMRGPKAAPTDDWVAMPQPEGTARGISYPIGSGRTYTLTADRDGLAGLRFQVGTYGKPLRASLSITLSPVDRREGVARSAVWDPGAVCDHDWATFLFDPILNSMGRAFKVRIDAHYLGYEAPISVFQFERAPLSLARKIEKRLLDRASVPSGWLLFARPSGL